MYFTFTPIIVYISVYLVYSGKQSMLKQVTATDAKIRNITLSINPFKAV